jgi:hypothetical protein
LRAAHLLYFVIKDHPFADGNKRIGTPTERPDHPPGDGAAGG